MVALGCLIAVSLGQRGTPLAEYGVQMQAREIRSGSGGTARGVTLYVPRDAQGRRYYFSESLSGSRSSGAFAYSSIDSWSTQDGKPVAAIYRLESPKLTQVVRIKTEDETIVLDETVTKVGSSPTETHLRIPLTKAALWQLSQFHPRDLFLAEGGSASFDMVDPIAKKIDAAKITREVTAREEIAKNVLILVQRYRLVTETHEVQIVLNDSGEFVRSIDSDGTKMRAVELGPLERDRLIGRASSVLQRTPISN